jgi:TetR/AcrR family transcriptional regulator
MAPPTIHINNTANLMMAYAEGRILQFVRSNFAESPTREWDAQWGLIGQAVFGTVEA